MTASLKSVIFVFPFIAFLNSCSGLTSSVSEQSVEPDILTASDSIIASKSNQLSCITTSAGAIKCFGTGYGNSFLDLTTRGIPRTIADTSTFTKLSVGYDSACGITAAGVLKCWGDNTAGALGDGTSTFRSTPIVIDSGTSYSFISISGMGSCGITTAGVLKCWGSNSYGQVGDGTTTTRTTPVVIDSGTSYISVAQSGSTTCGVTSAGELKCWGYNLYGQVGDGTTTNRTTPTVIDSGVSYTSHIIFGSAHACGITSSGVLKCWGSNSSYQLGDGTTTNRLTPTLIDSGVTYSEVSASMTNSCGITTAGILKCWGGANFGSTATTPTVFDAGILYSKITTTSWYATCGITTAGVLKCWGEGSYIGNSSLIASTAPVAIDTSTSYAQVGNKDAFTCGLTTSGQIKCWGDDINYSLGDGLRGYYSTPTTITTDYKLASVSNSDEFNCFISTAGRLRCWGVNDYGQIGIGSSALSIDSPSEVDSSLTYSKVSTGRRFSCAITTGQKLKCWGYNLYGQLGDGTNTARTVPVEIDASNSYDHIELSNRYMACGLTTSGVLKCWGQNDYGQLGDGTTTNRTTPTVIDSGVQYSQISVGGNSFACGITAAGVLKCWGRNSNQLGDGTTTDRTTPTVIDSGVSYISISSGQYGSCGITTAGVLKCWGPNLAGEVGDGTTTSKSSPVVIDSGTSYESVSVGYSHTCAKTTAGVYKCWGDNTYGQLGDGTTTQRLTPTVVLNP